MESLMRHPAFLLAPALIVISLLITVSLPRAHAGEALLEVARAQYQEAYRTGHITSVIEFAHNTEARYADTPGRAVPNFAERSCTVFLSSDAVRRFGFDNGIPLRFMVFHEMAHCDLYFSLRTLQTFPELSDQANLLLSDLLEIEYLFPTGSRHLNGYIAYHELYADIKALALLKREGKTWEEVEPIWMFRTNSLASLMGGHDSAETLKQVPFRVWDHLLPAALDDQVRTLTDRHILTTFIESVFSPLPLHFAASQQLEGGLRTICSTFFSRWATLREATFLKRRLWEASNSPKSLWQDVAHLMHESSECSEFVVRFFQHRYGKLVQHLTVPDAAIAAWLRRDEEE